MSLARLVHKTDDFGTECSIDREPVMVGILETKNEEVFGTAL